MSASIHTEKTIFLEAAEIASPAERAAYLARSCGDNQQLRAAVEALLQSHQRSHGALDATAVVAQHLTKSRANPELGRVRLLAPLPAPIYGNPEVQPLRGVPTTTS